MEILKDKKQMSFIPISSNSDFEIYLDAERLKESLCGILELQNLSMIKIKISDLYNSLKKFISNDKNITSCKSKNEIAIIEQSYVKLELNQIIETKTIERTKYYLKRLIKGLSEVRTSKINDINLNRWKDNLDILTDSLWIMQKRNNSGSHNGKYWGNFIPQIPEQLFKRYTKRYDWILDPFLGSGTSLIESKRLGRNGIGIELQKEVKEIANKNINNEKNPFDTKAVTINSDSANVDLKSILEKNNLKKVQFIIYHPPYFDIIKFSKDENDLSNAKSLEHFLIQFNKILDNTLPYLEENRYCALVIGDKYDKGEWIPLGFYCMQEFIKRKYLLKSVVVKNFEETKGKMNQKELWRYRALVGGFYIFKHEYIFIFKK